MQISGDQHGSSELSLHDTVVVVTGLPRSGTSLMMQMLEAGGIPIYCDAERLPDEDNPRGYFEHQAILRLMQDQSWVPSAKGHAIKVITALLQHLPKGLAYRVICMERDLDEVLASQAKMIERAGKRGGNLGPEKMKSAFAKSLDQARSWVLAQRGSALLNVRHREAIENPVGVAQAVREFTAATGSVEEMAAVVDPALFRNRRT